MRISAVFAGPEPSLGYVPGERYELVVKHHWVRDAQGVGQPCPYESVEAFLRNWTDIRLQDT